MRCGDRVVRTPILYVETANSVFQFQSRAVLMRTQPQKPDLDPITPIYQMPGRSSSLYPQKPDPNPITQPQLTKCQGVPGILMKMEWRPRVRGAHVELRRRVLL